MKATVKVNDVYATLFEDTFNVSSGLSPRKSTAELDVEGEEYWDPPSLAIAMAPAIGGYILPLINHEIHVDGRDEVYYSAYGIQDFGSYCGGLIIPAVHLFGGRIASVEKRLEGLRRYYHCLAQDYNGVAHTILVDKEYTPENVNWTRLYTGSEDDYYHGVCFAGNGSMIRARITLPADSMKLYRQTVTSPDDTSDYSSWTYTSQYNAAVCCCAALGAEVSIFWINGSTREIYHLKSTDSGATWAAPALIDYSPTTSVGGMAAAYKPNGDLAIFFADQSTLYIKKRISGGWQAKAAWDKTTGTLSSVAAAYRSDWELLVTGADSGGDFKLWSLVYGDGGDVTADTWSALLELKSATTASGYEYRAAFLDCSNIYQGMYVEKYTGTPSYQYPYRMYSLPGSTAFQSLEWEYKAEFEFEAEYGLAIASDGDYYWLSRPDGVWRAPYMLDTEQEIIDDLFSTYWPEIDTSTYVTGTDSVDPIIFPRIYLDEALQQLADLHTKNWLIDSVKYLHYFVPTTIEAPFELSDDPLFPLSIGYGEFSYEEDGTSIVNRVVVVGRDNNGDDIVVTRTSSGSYAEYNRYYDGKKVDRNINTQAWAELVGDAILEEQAFAKVIGSLICDRIGFVVGQRARITNARRGIDDYYIIQGLQISIVGGEMPRVQIEFGDYHADLIRLLLAIKDQQMKEN